MTAGKELTYEIKVTNTGSSPYRSWALRRLVPESVVFSPAGHRAGKVHRRGQPVRFEKMPELRPGESLDYRVHAKATQHGRWSSMSN